MKTHVSRIGAVVLLASILFMLLATQVARAGVSTSQVKLVNSSIVWRKAIANADVDRSAFGRTVFVPLTELEGHASELRISCQMIRTDGITAFEMSRLNLILLGVECIIVRGNNQTVSTGLLEDFTSVMLYTNATTSPSQNRGALIVPRDSVGNVVTSLVGTPVSDPNLFPMNGGRYLVHSDPNMKVYGVDFIGIPFTLDPAVVALLKDIAPEYPGQSLSLLAELDVAINMAITPQNGSFYFPSLLGSGSSCWVHYDGRLRPDGTDFGIVITNPNCIEIPKGCLSWLDVWESTDPALMGTKVNIEQCSLSAGTGLRTRISLTPSNPSRAFYTLRTRPL